MEDVTEVIVEPEPADDEPTSAEPEETVGGDGTFGSLAADTHPQRTDGPVVSPRVSGASCEPVPTEDQRILVETSLPGGQSSPGARRSVAFLAVFDGHGGREAAQFAREYLWEFMKKQRGFWSDCDLEVCAAIRKGFIACHHAMWKKLRMLLSYSPLQCHDIYRCTLWTWAAGCASSSGSVDHMSANLWM